MRLDLASLWTVTRLTLQQPRVAAKILVRMDLPLVVGWSAIALMVVISALLSSLAFLASPIEIEPAMAALFLNPINLALMQGLILLVGLMLVHGVGRLFGGRGRFSDALVLVAWMEFVLILLQVVQMALLLLIPPLAEMLGLLGVAIFLWLLSHFVAELHGFNSAGLVFLTVIGTVLAISFGAALLTAVFLGVGA